MNVLFLHRARSFGGFSFEELFSTIKKHITKFSYQDFYDKTYSSFVKNLKAIKKIDADVIHITGGLGYYALFLPTKKTILTVHDTNHYEHDLSGFKKWLFGHLFYKIPYKNTSFITTVSEHTKSRLIELFSFDERRIHVIHNCYPEDFSVKEKKELAPAVKILQIGTKKNKNLDRLIDALKGLNIELTIVGKISGEIKIKLEQTNINYINKTNLTHKEIYNEYVNTDIVSFISLHEGFGLPIIEANAVGRAVITSNISSMPEVGGKAAHYINPYDTNDIKEGILRLINDDEYRNQLIKDGLINIKRFTPEKKAAEYEELYQSIIIKNQ